MATLDGKTTLEDVEPYIPPVPPTLPTAPDSATFEAPEITTITQPVISGYQAPTVYAPEKEATVEGRLGGLLESGSPYLERARTSAKMEAQKRGLLNSSMAASAGEKAAIEAALPIAQQDASAYLNAGMAGYQGEIEAAQSALGYEQQKGLVGVQATATSELQAQATKEAAALDAFKADIASGLSTQEAVQKAYQTSYEGAITAGLSKQDAEQKAILESQKAQAQFELQGAELQNRLDLLQKDYEQKVGTAGKPGLIATQAEEDRKIEAMRQEGANQRAALDREIQVMQLEGENLRAAASLDVDSSRISAAMRQDALAQGASLAKSYKDDIVAIQQNPNIPQEGKTSLLAERRDRYISDLKMISDLTGVSISWGEITPTPTPTPTTTAIKYPGKPAWMTDEEYEQSQGGGGD